MIVKFLRVVSQPERRPSEKQVIAVAGDYLVKLSRRDGWTCNCETEGDQCDHVDAVEDLLDDRVAKHGWSDAG